MLINQNLSKMKQFKLLSALLMCFLALGLPGYAADEIKYFVLWHGDGSSTALALQEHPRIRVDAANKQLICATDTREISLNMADVRRYSFEKAGVVTSVEAISAPAGTLDKKGETVVLGNFAAETQVNVYSAAGMLKESHTTDKEGNLTIHTNSWEKGLYIIKTEKTTYKILVK